MRDDLLLWPPALEEREGAPAVPLAPHPFLLTWHESLAPAFQLLTGEAARGGPNQGLPLGPQKAFQAIESNLSFRVIGHYSRV